jgi:diguanylate cyclase (GGDEF)-like protein/PAS domain S-box-containing protein
VRGSRRRLEQRIFLACALALELGLIGTFALRGDVEGLERQVGWKGLAVASAVLFLLYVLYVELRVNRSARALEDSQALYQSLVETLPQYVFRKDPSGRVEYANGRLLRLLGKSAEEIAGKRVEEFLPAALAQGSARIEEQRATSKEPAEDEVHTPLPDGRQAYFRITQTPVLDPKGHAIGTQAIFWDVTPEKLAEIALRKSEERYALAVQGAKDGLWDWDLGTNEVYYSPRWKSMLGFSIEDLGTSPDEWMKRVHAEDLGRLKASMASHVLGHIPHFECEYRIAGKEGAYRWMLARGIAVRNGAGQVTRIAGSQTDISDRKEVEERLLRQALYDPLTGLPNRTLFMDRLRQTLRRARRNPKKSCAVLFLDMDRFKEVNDSLGHATGDQLLVAFARRLEKSVRPGDTVARLGGDEFTVLLEDVRGLDDAVRVAERTQKDFAAPFALDGQEVFVTVSIGIAPGGSYEHPEELLRDADTAMYRAKERGRACFEVFDQGMHSRAVERLKLESELRRALERQEFRLHYQPIVSASDEGLLGFEALVRWQHPRRGLLPPSEFLGLAEETGLILPLDLWVMSEACHQIRRWHEEYPDHAGLTISVNLSGRHFAQRELVEEIREILTQSLLSPESLAVEITETVLLEGTQAVLDTLSGLKKLGVKLYLDDFGTGYSSLHYLHRLPFDRLKIDRSFVQQLGTESNQEQVVRTILALARQLSMGVVAEGVETRDQLHRLRSFECEQVQGFLISKPLEPENAEALLGQRKPVQQP